MQQGCKKETISISWGRTSNLEDHLSEEVVVSNPPLRSFGKGTAPDIDLLTLNFSPLINWDDLQLQVGVLWLISHELCAQCGDGDDCQAVDGRAYISPE